MSGAVPRRGSTAALVGAALVGAMCHLCALVGAVLCAFCVLPFPRERINYEDVVEVKDVVEIEELLDDTLAWLCSESSPLSGCPFGVGVSCLRLGLPTSGSMPSSTPGGA